MNHEEHNEDDANCECGQHKKLSPEKEAKLKAITNKTKDLMSEALELTATDEELEEYEKKFKETFKKQGIPWIYSNLKTFSAGIDFGVFISSKLEFQATTQMHLNRIMRKMEKHIKSQTDKM